MSFYFIKNNRLMVVFVIFFCFILTVKVNASDCGVLQLQDNKSSGVLIKENNCSGLASVSRGAIFELSPRGRLWLKSKSSEYISSDFQLICQNRSGNNLQLEFSDMLSPWLNLSKLNNCSGWIDNKLSCEGKGGEKRGIYCVLAFIKTGSGVESNQVQRTTSVKMRTLNSLREPAAAPVSMNKNQILEAINPELQLCKKLNQVTHVMELKWTVEPNNKVTEIELISAGRGIEYGLSDCAEAVVTTFLYPEFSEKVSFDSTF